MRQTTRAICISNQEIRLENATKMAKIGLENANFPAQTFAPEEYRITYKEARCLIASLVHLRNCDELALKNEGKAAFAPYPRYRFFDPAFCYALAFFSALPSFTLLAV